MIKKVLIFIITFSLFLVCVNAKTKKKYLALGDSITEGYTLENKEEDCYASLFAKKYNFELTNEAVAGDKTSDLLSKLDNYNIDDYDVITICIGANDIFYEFTEKFYSIGVKNLPELYDAIFNDPELDNRIEEDAKVLDQNLKTIMERIRKGHAQIYMMNVYNPFNNAVIEGLDEVADKYVKKINAVIEKHTEGTTFINLYKKLKNDKGIINSQVIGSQIFDPHPTVKGHQRIFSIIDEQYDKNNITTTSIVLIITLGLITIIFEITEMIFCIKKFTFKNVNNSVVKPKIEEKEEEKKDSSRFIRS